MSEPDPPETEGVDSFLREIARVPDQRPDESLVGRDLDHFRLTARLGRGGMGVVYQADDRKLARQVAIKVLPAETRDNPARRERLIREARSAAKLIHPNIATVFEVGDHADGLYIAMEYVRGETLRTRLARDGAQPAHEALRIVNDVAEALAVAHAHGIVHRDIKPDNVMITEQGVVKVLDFGIAKSGGEELPTDLVYPSDGGLQTGTGLAVGTPGYMAPEQRLGLETDARADVYALGLLALELLTGERQRGGETVDLDALDAAPTHAETRGSGLPRGLRALLNRATDADPERRPEDGAAFAAELRAWTVAADRRRRRVTLLRISAGVVTALALAGAAAGLWAWDQTRLKHSWAPDLVFRAGVPVPSGTWDPARLQGYRFTTRGGRVQRVQLQTTQGAPVGWPVDHPSSSWDRLEGMSLGRELLYPCTHGADRFNTDLAFCAERKMKRIETPVEIVVRYDEAGGLDGLEWRNDAGLLLHRDVYERVQGGFIVRRVDTHGLPRRGPYGAAIWREELDPDGFVVGRRWLDLQGELMSVAQYGAGVSIEHDGAGREVSRTWVTTDGSPLPDALVQSIRTERDSAGRVIRTAYFDASGPVVGPGGCVRLELERDPAGRLTSQTCFDAEGPVPDASGCTTTVWAYRAAQTERACLNADGEPVGRDGWSSVVFERDDRGLPITMRFLDEGGSPVIPTIKASLPNIGDGLWLPGPARIEATRDDHGRLTGAAWFDEDGQPMRSPERWARWTAERDELGWVTRWTYLDEHGAPTPSIYAFARTEVQVRADGGRVAKHRYLADGEPLRADRHIARADFELGRVVGWSCYDADDQPTQCAEPMGHHRVRRVLDELSLPVERSYFGLDDQPVAPDGVHRVVRSHDSTGRWIDKRRYGVLREPVLGPNGCHHEQRSFASSGQVQIQKCFDTQGRLTRSRNLGAAGVERTFDAGRVATETRLGSDGEVIEVRTYTYDRAGNRVGMRVVDESGGFRRALAFTYDAQGRRTGRTRVRADGSPNNGRDGVATVRDTLDRYGRVRQRAWFDAVGAPVVPSGSGGARRVFTYDAVGKQTSSTWLDAEGQPTAGPDGLHRQTSVYGPTGELLRRERFPVPGGELHPAMPPVEERTYTIGRLTRLTLRDHAGDAITSAVPVGGWPPTPFSHVVFDWDDARRLTHIGFRAVDGSPAVCPAGFSDVRLAWTDALEVDVRYAVGEATVILTEGVAWPWWGQGGERSALLEPGHVPSGAVVDQRGIAGFTAVLHPTGGATSVRFLGVDGTPTPVQGRSGWERSWTQGVADAPVWLDEAGRPVGP